MGTVGGKRSHSRFYLPVSLYAAIQLMTRLIQQAIETKERKKSFAAKTPLPLFSHHGDRLETSRVNFDVTTSD